MGSQKKSRLKRCIKCNVKLTNKNWLTYLKPRSNYICTPCFRNYGKQHYKLDSQYNKKQLARYRGRKSAIIHFYGDMCALCGENDYYKLTIDYKSHTNNTPKISTNSIYEWLYNNPIQCDGYQILCYNCSYNKNTKYKDAYAFRDKNKIIEAYGNQCIECRENKIKCLTIDYTNNPEHLHLTGVYLYRWVIKNNYPKYLNILCYNCKRSKIAKNKFTSLQALEHEKHPC